MKRVAQTHPTPTPRAKKEEKRWSRGRGDLVRALSRPLAAGSGWMKLVAVTLVISALSIVGIVVAWLPIWMGALLWQASGLASDAQLTGQPEAPQQALLKLKTYFVITGVLTLLGLLLWVAMVIFGIATGGTRWGTRRRPNRLRQPAPHAPASGRVPETPLPRAV